MSTQCLSCRSSKAQFTCGLCTDPVCRHCAEFMPEDAFLYLASRPAELQHDAYCGRCFDTSVAPAIETYNEMVEKAAAVVVVSKKYRGEVHTLRKSKDQVKVPQCPDRKEVLMRLAFQAVEQGFNALVLAEIKSEKVRHHGYQKMLWSGHALPAEIDPTRTDLAEFEGYL